MNVMRHVAKVAESEIARWLRISVFYGATTACGAAANGSDTNGDEVSGTMGASGSATDVGGGVTSGGSEAETGEEGGSSEGEPTGCGDGIVDSGEDCDDGNALNADGCNVDCHPSGRELWRDVVDGDENQDEAASGVTIALDGRITAVGSIWRTGESRDCLVRTYEVDGMLAWSSARGGDAKLNDACVGVAVDSIGGVVASGFFGTAGVASEGVVFAFDRDGALVWSETVASDEGRQTYLEEIAATPDGAMLVAGNRGTLEGRRDAWIGRYGAGGGTPSWTDTWDFGPQDSTSGLDVAEEGWFVAAGSEDAETFFRFWLRKYDATGEPLWIVRATEPHTMAGGVALMHDGGILLSGQFTDTQSTGESDAFVRAFSSEGDVSWTYWHENDSNDVASAIEVDSAGDIVVVGSQYLDGTTTQLWVDKLSPEGSLLWTFAVPAVDEWRQSVGVDVAIDPRPDPTVRDQIVVVGSLSRAPQGHGFAVLRLSP